MNGSFDLFSFSMFAVILVLVVQVGLYVISGNLAIQSGGSKFGMKVETTPLDKSCLKVLSGPVSCVELPETTRPYTRKGRKSSEMLCHAPNAVVACACACCAYACCACACCAYACCAYACSSPGASTLCMHLRRFRTEPDEIHPLGPAGPAEAPGPEQA